MPFTWVFILIILTYFSKSLKVKKWSFCLVLVLLFVGSNKFLVNYLLYSWESPVKQFSEIKPSYEYGIVLTGVTLQKSPDDRVFFQKGADRATHTLQLYKKGVLKNILITGGKPGIVEYGESEAEILRRFFIMAGVPTENIVLENKAKNTFENAQLTAELLKKKSVNTENLLLITSAFHMKRSEGCFRKAGLKFDTFPVDYYTQEPKMKDLFLMPDIQNFANFSLLIHEVLGYIVYQITGKL